MKELTNMEMEIIEGGWSWASCIGGAGLVVETGLAEYAAIVTGGLGFWGALAVGCVVGGLTEV